MSAGDHERSLGVDRPNSPHSVDSAGVRQRKIGHDEAPVLVSQTLERRGQPSLDLHLDPAMHSVGKQHEELGVGIAVFDQEHFHPERNLGAAATGAEGGLHGMLEAGAKIVALPGLQEDRDDRLLELTI